MQKSIRARIVRSLKMRERVLSFFGGTMQKKQHSFYFHAGELALWGGSVLLILLSFFVFDGENALILCASLIGVTSLILNAKGNPIGQLLMVAFSVLYGIISFSFRYYGEMLTYLGMTMPMAILSLVSWLRHPYAGNRAQVKVNTIGKKELLSMAAACGAVTAGFYFILRYFNTANLLPSTLSVATSFIAAYLTLRRSPLFALGYAANDIVLLVLWGMASAAKMQYLSVFVCFATFLCNDIYGYISWEKMRRRQLSQALGQK